MKDRKQILKYYLDKDLPITPRLGVLIALDTPEEIKDGIYVPTSQEISIRNPSTETGVVLFMTNKSDIINVGDRVMFSSIKGSKHNINGHIFYTLQEEDIMAIIND